MAMSKNISNYRHVAPVLDAALENKGGVYTLGSKQEAFRWRAEAYMYRRLLGTPLYDDLVMTVSGPSVNLSLRKLTGVFMSPTGKVVKLAKKISPDEIDPLEKYAMELGLEVVDDEGDGQ